MPHLAPLPLPLLILSSILSSFLAFLPSSLPAAEDVVWVEGEHPTRGKGFPHPWYSQAVKKELLSDGGFLSSFTNQGDTEVDYDLSVPHEGAWTLWARINPVAAKVSWRLDGGAWQAIDLSTAVDRQNIASDNKPDLRFLAWVRIGSLPLKAGKLSLGFKLHSDNNHHGALDCFLLTTGLFTPSGKLKPGAVATEAEAGWWAFSPATDPFAKEALLDLRPLNEPHAGGQGPISARGGDLVGGDGKVLRFWAVNAAPAADDEQAVYLARRLAKTGVNLVRMHGGIFDRQGSDPDAIDARHLDRIHYQVKAHAEQGIYTYLSTYFPLWLTLKASDGVAGGALGKHPFALLIIEPAFQEHYRAWTRRILTTRNPSTGHTLAEDDAVAFFEIQNEDSLFFWTFKPEDLGAGPCARLETRFATWAALSHGSLEKAFAAWDHHGRDDAGAKRAGLYGAWEMSSGGYAQAGSAKQSRIRDQIRFLGELQHGFYASMRQFVKQELGFHGLVTASNWTTADNRQLGGIERWSYTACDIIDRHGYFGGKHEGESAAWSVRPGHTFTDKAAVLDPAGTLLGYHQLAGRPHLHSEIAWNKPNRFIADGDLLTASYAALQGVNGYIFFAAQAGTWCSDPASKWTLMMPGELGQFPATALQFRRGDVQAGPTVIRQVQRVEDLWQLKGSGFIEGDNADFRTADAPRSGDASVLSAFDPLSYFVGRVERVLTGMPGAPADAVPLARDLSRFIARDAKTVTSATGELRWDWGRGLITVDSPRSQAAAGFLAKAGTVRLGEVAIESGNDYGCIHVIALDDQSLATAHRILIQAFSEERMFGFRAVNGRIEDVGRAPINVRDISASVTFAHGGGLTAVALDGHGYRRSPLAMDGGRVVLARDALYTLVSR